MKSSGGIAHAENERREIATRARGPPRSNDCVADMFDAGIARIVVQNGETPLSRKRLQKDRCATVIRFRHLCRMQSRTNVDDLGVRKFSSNELATCSVIGRGREDVVDVFLVSIFAGDAQTFLYVEACDDAQVLEDSLEEHGGSRVEVGRGVPRRRRREGNDE